MKTTPRKNTAPSSAAPNRPDAVDGKNKQFPIPSKPETSVPVTSSVEDVVRAMEGKQTGEYVVVDAKTLREASKVFLQRNLGERSGMTADGAPIFTPEHLNVLFGDLTRAQQTFLLLLLQTPGVLVSREKLLRAIRGDSFVANAKDSSHSLNQLACVLRKKLGANGAGRCIETVHGVGFRWNRKLEPKALSLDFLRVVGLALLTALVVVVYGINQTSPRQKTKGDVFALPGTNGNDLASNGAQTASDTAGSAVPSKTFQAMRTFSGSDSFGEPIASVGHAKGHSPWRTIDGSDETWFESAAPARKGDWLSLGLPASSEPASEDGKGRRIEILCGRPGEDGERRAAPCRVEISSDIPGEESDAWRSLGDVDPSTGLFSADLPASSVPAIRIVVTADSELPFIVSEVKHIP